MSAIGSVIVMAWWPSSPRFPLQGFRGHGLRPRGPPRDLRCGRWVFSHPGGRDLSLSSVVVGDSLVASRPLSSRLERVSPARLGDAGQFAAVRHLAEAHAAQAEPAVDRTRATAAGA